MGGRPALEAWDATLGMRPAQQEVAAMGTRGRAQKMLGAAGELDVRAADVLLRRHPGRSFRPMR
eukprot:CAMPEP_0177248486 /NCGR_PEP_ID=MMETSP0367-20130122/52201_1 /TAXON_ID=447022 ORGANISM="Scrippsiella hangoei-like, Strain SHHI-4" /NCGR_SAMPLE_ID=MMETSP0367 /ASSEMBLY_ACC=CAM_ASM_000362 /LENGTH=63 /DNA_ID=CAMNT_0018700841 /DNA_START=472 /DNA_END=660 /DNA_ORIENTATION=-